MANYSSMMIFCGFLIDDPAVKIGQGLIVMLKVAFEIMYVMCMKNSWNVLFFITGHPRWTENIDSQV